MNAKRAAAVASLAAVSAVPMAPPARGSTASRMVDRINSARAARGLRALRTSQAVNRASHRWASFLIRRDFLGHTSLRAAKVKGEVIEMHSGSSSKVNRTVRAWLNSPGHRAILLSPRFHRIGVGKSTGNFQGIRATIWVGRFK